MAGREQNKSLPLQRQAHKCFYKKSLDIQRKGCFEGDPCKNLDWKKKKLIMYEKYISARMTLKK